MVSCAVSMDNAWTLMRWARLRVYVRVFFRAAIMRCTSRAMVGQISRLKTINQQLVQPAPPSVDVDLSVAIYQSIHTARSNSRMYHVIHGESKNGVVKESGRELCSNELVSHARNAGILCTHVFETFDVSTLNVLYRETS